MLLIFHFNIEEIGLEMKKYYKSRYSKTLDKNSNVFVEWVANVLKKHVPVLPKGFQYNACALRINTNNSDILNKHLDPMVWLNYCPTTDDSLRDDQLGLEINEVVVQDK
jgi:hypothetical protein